jgi:hypothetical protein
MDIFFMHNYFLSFHTSITAWMLSGDAFLEDSLLFFFLKNSSHDVDGS